MGSYDYKGSVGTAAPGYYSKGAVQARAKKGWQLAGVTLGEVTGYFDAIRLFTGKDPITGKPASRIAAGASVAIDVASMVFPPAKAGKIGQAVDKIDDVVDATRRTAKAVDKVDDAVDAGRATRAADLISDAIDPKKIRDSASVIRNTGGETVAGHALQKHSGRNPSIWGKVSGNSENINAQAMQHIDDILSAPGEFSKVTTDRGVAFLEKTLPDGRGIRLNMDGTFKGFIDQ